MSQQYISFVEFFYLLLVLGMTQLAVPKILESVDVESDLPVLFAEKDKRSLVV
jgi:hypothetical protein